MNKFKVLSSLNFKVCFNDCLNLHDACFLSFADLFPNKQNELDDFRSYLTESSNPMTPLKAWQMQDLSFQCAVRALQEKTSEEAFRTLVELSQNFPSRAR